MPQNGVFRNSSSTQPKDLSMGSYFYDNGNMKGTTLDLIPKGAASGNSMKQMFPISYSFHNKSSAQTFEALMDFRYTPYPVSDTEGNLGYVVSTCNNKFFVPAEDMAQYGAVFNPRDEGAKHMDRWIGSTVGNHQIEYARSNREEGLWEMPAHIPDLAQYGMTDVRVAINDLAGSVPINKVGLYASKLFNLKQDLGDVIFRNYVTSGVGFNPETEAFLDFLIKEKGLEPERDIKAIGVEKMEGGVIARAYTNGLAASKDIYQYAANIAKSYGLKGEEAVRFAKRAFWYHELYHILDQRKGLSEKETEIDVGEALAEFFSERASLVGEKAARYYKAIAKENRAYAQKWEEGILKSRRGKSFMGIESLIQQYASEAREMGMSEEEARDYVASRLEQEANKTKEGNSKGAKGRSAGKGKGDARNASAEEDAQEQKASEEAESNAEAADSGAAEAN